MDTTSEFSAPIQDAEGNNDTTHHARNQGARLPEATAEERITEALRILAESTESLIGKELKLKDIAKEFDLGMIAIRQAFEQAEQDVASRSAPTPSEPTPEQLARQAQEQALEQKLQQEAEELFRTPDIFVEFNRDLERRGYIADKVLANSLLISHGTRLLPHSTAFMLAGASGSGKSDAAIKGADFLPPEIVKSITAASAQAFYYLGDIRHKYLVMGEMRPTREGEDDYRQTAMRQLISENCLTRQTVERVDGENVAVEKVTEGPCVIVATSTTDQTQWHDEFANRLSWVRTRDDHATTQQVLEMQAMRAAQPWERGSKGDLTARWHRYHRLLQPKAVSISYAPHIKPSLNHVTARRLYNLIITYVKASTLLHQGSRTTTTRGGTEYLEATICDYEIAYELLCLNAPRVLDLCSKPAREAYQRLTNHLQHQRKLTTAEIQRTLNEPGSTVRRWLRQLTDAGLLLKAEGTGKHNVYWLGDTEPKEQDLGLVSPARLRAILGQALADATTSDADELATREP